MDVEDLPFSTELFICKNHRDWPLHVSANAAHIAAIIKDNPVDWDVFKVTIGSATKMEFVWPVAATLRENEDKI